MRTDSNECPKVTEDQVWAARCTQHAIVAVPTLAVMIAIMKAQPSHVGFTACLVVFALYVGTSIGLTLPLPRSLRGTRVTA